MNYLAHLHVATQCESQLMGNLLADFVKGRPDNQFSLQTVEGIYLHRFVDSTIDALPEIKPVASVFHPHYIDTARLRSTYFGITR
ncbi:hypothetical protein P4S70_16780 [Enterovibrio sp. Hal110]